MLQRDQFELLSAYLDGEVTATERRQVEELLRNDDKTQRLYTRLMKLREGFQGMPLTASQPVEDTVAQVMQRLEQPRPRRRRTWTLIGGGAIAAATVAAFGGIFGESPLLQFARGPVPGSPAVIDSPESIVVIKPALSTDALMIAIDEPLLGLDQEEASGDLTPIPPANQDVN